MLLAMSCITPTYSRTESNRAQTFMQVKMCMRDKGHITQGSLCLWMMLGKREDRLFSRVVWMLAWRSGEAWGHFLRAFIISEFYVAPDSGRWAAFPSCGSAGKESACNAGDLGSNPGLGRSPREGQSYPLQYSGLENTVDYIVQGVSKSRKWLNDFHFTSIS